MVIGRSSRRCLNAIQARSLAEAYPIVSIMYMTPVALFFVISGSSFCVLILRLIPRPRCPRGYSNIHSNHDLVQISLKALFPSCSHALGFLALACSILLRGYQ